jgi:hypothetical protein
MLTMGLDEGKFGWLKDEAKARNMTPLLLVECIIGKYFLLIPDKRAALLEKVATKETADGH